MPLFSGASWYLTKPVELKNSFVANSIAPVANVIIKNQFREPPLVVTNHATALQQISGHIFQPDFAQFFQGRINRLSALLAVAPQNFRRRRGAVDHCRME